MDHHLRIPVLIRAAALSAAATLAFGCASAPPSQTPAQSLPPMPDFVPAVVGPGDVLQVSFFESGAVYPDAYRVRPGDVLSITVLDHPELESARVLVLPDGAISAPGVQRLVAVGRTLEEIGAELRERYAALRIRDPKATVSVIQADNRAEALLRAGFGGGSRDLLITVDPAGYIDLPYIAPIQSGRPLGEIQAEIREAYLQEFDGRIEATVNLRERTPPRVFVFGEVNNPGDVAFSQPLTVVQAIASAGGVMNTADRDEVRLFRLRSDGEFEVRELNFRRDVGRFADRAGAQFIMQPNDVVYVPQSGIAIANVAIEQYIRNMMPNNLGLALTYRVDD